MGPSQPSSSQIAQQQAASNINTAVAQSQLNNVNQVTPTGNLTYSKTGSSTVDGNTVPQYTATTTLSPTQQALLGQQEQFGKQVNDLGISQTERLQGVLDQPINLSDPSIGAETMARYQPRFDEQWGNDLSSLDTQLANKGIRVGSTAYDRAIGDFNKSKADAYNQLMINARGSTLSEMLAARNQPINEVTALMSGGQVSAPNFVSTPQTGVANTDVAGITQNAYAQQQAKQNATLGGLFGLGSAGISGWAMSDRKTKEDIKPVGKLNDGTKLYSFRYKPEFGGNGIMQLGVMADEVEDKHPEAVAEIIPGVEAVNYSALAEALSERAA